MLIVACDPGTKHCAFAIYKNGKLVRTEKVKSTFDKLKAFFDGVKETFTLVIEDQYLNLNVRTLKKLVEVRTTVTVLARLYRADKCLVVPPQKWQQIELGLNVKSKREQRKRVAQMVASSIAKEKIQDSDIADAVCIGDFYLKSNYINVGGVL